MQVELTDSGANSSPTSPKAQAAIALKNQRERERRNLWVAVVVFEACGGDR